MIVILPWDGGRREGSFTSSSSAVTPGSKWTLRERGSVWPLIRRPPLSIVGYIPSLLVWYLALPLCRLCLPLIELREFQKLQMCTKADVQRPRDLFCFFKNSFTHENFSLSTQGVFHISNLNFCGSLLEPSMNLWTRTAPNQLPSTTTTATGIIL